MSASSKAGCPARSMTARISGIRLRTPVEVSLCTTVTAAIACARSASSRSPTTSGSTP